jgi:hypothetical protein
MDNLEDFELVVITSDRSPALLWHSSVSPRPCQLCYIILNTISCSMSVNTSQLLLPQAGKKVRAWFLLIFCRLDRPLLVSQS